MATRGLVLLAKDTFSGVSSVSFDNVFSATYKQYKIIANANASIANTPLIYFRAGGVDDTTAANYRRQFISVDAGTTTAARQTSINGWTNITGYLTASNISEISITEILNPFQTAYASGFSNYSQNSTGNILATTIAFGLTVTTSYDGFTWQPQSTTASGTITVYGLDF